MIRIHDENKAYAMQTRFEDSISSVYAGFVSKMCGNFSDDSSIGLRPTFIFYDDESGSASDPKNNIIAIGKKDFRAKAFKLYGAEPSDECVDLSDDPDEVVSEQDLETIMMKARFDCIHEAAHHLHYRGNEKFQDAFYIPEIDARFGHLRDWSPERIMLDLVAYLGAYAYVEMSRQNNGKVSIDVSEPEHPILKCAADLYEKHKRKKHVKTYHHKLLKELASLSPEKFKTKLNRMFDRYFFRDMNWKIDRYRKGG